MARDHQRSDWVAVRNRIGGDGDMSDDEDTSGRLHPEGAPGIWDAFQRSVMGDANYEANQATLQKVTEISLRQLEAKTKLWAALPGVVMIVTLALVFCLVWVTVT